MKKVPKQNAVDKNISMCLNGPVKAQTKSNKKLQQDLIAVIGMQSWHILEDLQQLLKQVMDTQRIESGG